jgi:hypothetical protein
MELPTAQEKSEQIFFAILDAQQYTFRDKHDCSATFTAPNVKEIITPTNKELHQQSMNSYDV